jgi:hypothetical protein
MRDFFNGMKPCLGSISGSARASLQLPPIAGYAPHPDRSYWLLILGLVTIVYLALTLH